MVVFLFQCNFDLKYLSIDLSPLVFYEEALEARQGINCRSPEFKEQILNEIIWNNRFIRIEGYSIYYKQWHEAGVTRIRDIFNGGSFLTFNDFPSKFSIKTNFLRYHGLCHTIPQKWIKKFAHSLTHDHYTEWHVG